MTLLIVLANAVIGMSGPTGRAGRHRPAGPTSGRPRRPRSRHRADGQRDRRGSASPSRSPSSQARERQATSASSATEIDPQTRGWRSQRLTASAATRRHPVVSPRPAGRRPGIGHESGDPLEGDPIDGLDDERGADRQVDRRRDDRELGARDGPGARARSAASPTCTRKPTSASPASARCAVNAPSSRPTGPLTSRDRQRGARVQHHGSQPLPWTTRGRTVDPAQRGREAAGCPNRPTVPPRRASTIRSAP